MVIEDPAEAEENLQKLLTQREEVALAGCVHFGPKAFIDDLLPTTTRIAASTFVPRGENKTRKPERGPSLTFLPLWGSDKSGTYS